MADALRKLRLWAEWIDRDYPTGADDAQIAWYPRVNYDDPDADCTLTVGDLRGLRQGVEPNEKQPVTPEAFRERWPSIAAIQCVGDILDVLSIEMEAGRLAREKVLAQYREVTTLRTALRRALEPIVSAVNWYGDETADDHIAWWTGVGDEPRITVGDLRRLAALAADPNLED